MVGIVPESFSPIKSDVVAHVLQSRRHELVGQWPAAEGVVEVTAGVGKVNTERFGFGFADMRRVDVAAAKIGEAADGREHFAEGIGTFPSHGERADTAGACAANSPHLGVFGHTVAFFDFGDNLFDQEASVTITETVVFETAIGVFPRAIRLTFRFVVSWVDENCDCRWHVAASDKIIEHDGNPKASLHIEVRMAILENHQRGRLFFPVLSWYVDGPVADSILKYFGFPRSQLFDAAMGHVFTYDSVWMRLPGLLILGLDRQRC